MKKDQKKKGTGRFVLDVIDLFLGIPEAMVYAFDRKEFYRILNGSITERALTCDNIAKLISNLKRSHYIEVTKQGGNESIKFTNKAKLAIVDRIGARSAVDDRNRFISFDIPERFRAGRDKFRRTIKRLGFRQIQKSLWVCNKSIGDIAELAAIEYGVQDYVVYIVADCTNIDSFISEQFRK